MSVSSSIRASISCASRSALSGDGRTSASVGDIFALRHPCGIHTLRGLVQPAHDEWVASAVTREGEWGLGGGTIQNQGRPFLTVNVITIRRSQYRDAWHLLGRSE